MEINDELVLYFGEVATLEAGAQVVDPAQAATLTAPEKAGLLGERAPAPFSVGADVSYKAVVFLLGPCSFVDVGLLAAWRPPHLTLEPTRIESSTFLPLLAPAIYR